MSTLRRTFVSGLLCLMTALILGTGTAATGSHTTAAPAHRAVSFDAPGQASVRPHDSGNCSNMATLAKCVMKILAPAGGIHGVYLQRIGGSVLASDNASYPFEPASSIKPVIALYAITQVEKGLAHLSDRVPRIDESGGREDCPPDTFSGTEPLGTALQQMMEVSDNNRTDELMQYFGVAHLNAFATSLGMRHTRFHTSPIPPGFNVIGCLSYGYDPLPHTVDGNTMSLADASKLWAAVAALPAHQGARINLVRALLATGEPHRTLEAADAALAALPDRAELHFAPIATSFHVGENPLQVVDTACQLLHFAEAAVHLFQLLAHQSKRFAEALLQRALEFLIHCLAHSFELLRVVFLDTSEAILDGFSQRIEAALVGGAQLGDAGAHLSAQPVRRFGRFGASSRQLFPQRTIVPVQRLLNSADL